jgi:carbonic anhydrase
MEDSNNPKHHDNERCYEALFANNDRWVENMLTTDPEYFKRMARGQSPNFLFVGCSDSRVPAQTITGTGPGEMFIHRNIANQALPSDLNFLSVLQYSVQVLKVKHIIVCGHYGCGGVKAALEGRHNGLLDCWLYGIKRIYRLVVSSC